MKRSKRMLTVGAISAAALLVPQAAFASGGSAYYWNNAWAETHRTWSQDFRVAFDLEQTGAGQVNAVNHSFASTHDCSFCSSTAIAFQVIVTRSSPVGLNVDNQAVAISLRCSNCATNATAYEFVLEEANPTRLPDWARDSLRNIQWRLYALRWSGLYGDALQAAIDELAGEVQGVLSSVNPPQSFAPLANAKASPTAPSIAAAPLAAQAPVAAPSAQVLVYRQASAQ